MFFYSFYFVRLPSFLYDAAAQNADGEQEVIFYQRISLTNFYHAGVLRSPGLQELLSSAQHCCSQKGEKKGRSGSKTLKKLLSSFVRSQHGRI